MSVVRLTFFLRELFSDNHSFHTNMKFVTAALLAGSSALIGRTHATEEVLHQTKQIWLTGTAAKALNDDKDDMHIVAATESIGDYLVAVVPEEKDKVQEVGAVIQGAKHPNEEQDGGHRLLKKDPNLRQRFVEQDSVQALKTSDKKDHGRHLQSPYYVSSCQEIYTDARGTFEGILYSSMAFWLFLTVVFLPKNEEQEQQQRGRCCSFLVPCLRKMTFCLESCRPLLNRDDNEVANTAQEVGTCAATSFIAVFLFLQAVPLLALIIGLVSFYPHCPCSIPNACKCTLMINGIPVGSCTGGAIFFASVTSLGALAFANKAIQKLCVIQNARSYSATQMTIESEQEMI